MNIKSIFAISFVLLIIIGLSGCKSNKEVPEKPSAYSTNTEVEIIPCQNIEFSDENFFRTTESSTSSDLLLAKEKSILLAKQRLARIINSNVESAVNSYMAERGINKEYEAGKKLKSIVTEVVDDFINDIAISCENVTTLPNRQYRAFVTVESLKKSILDEYIDKVLRDVKLKAIFDRKRFEEIFLSIPNF